MSRTNAYASEGASSTRLLVPTACRVPCQNRFDDGYRNMRTPAVLKPAVGVWLSGHVSVIRNNNALIWWWCSCSGQGRIERMHANGILDGMLAIWLLGLIAKAARSTLLDAN